MSDHKFRVGDSLPPAVPENDETAQVLLLTILASKYPEGMTVLDLEMELSNDGEDWVERAVRALAEADLVRCEGSMVFAAVGFPGVQSPKQPGSN
ncbi:MAG TPA: hypothetical protein VND98_05530 [Solirubrobacterales bacterium]|nr:hypothetical protein [Solirubrobacterales bacterium]